MNGRIASPDELTAPFWESARRHELRAAGVRHLRTKLLQPAGRLPPLSIHELAVRAELGHGCGVGHTTVHRPPEPAFVAPYVLALVEMDEGWDLLTRLLVEPPTDSLIGATRGGLVHA